MNIKGKNVLITGSNRGIGRAFVDAALAAGAAQVYATAREPGSFGDERVQTVALDVTDSQQISAAVKAASDVDLLINNAGTLRSFGLLEASRADLEHDLAVNFFGALEVTKGFLGVLESRQGAVLNVLTLVSMASMAGIGGYSASKAAAWSMTQALRQDLGKRGVQVFAVYPGAVDTDMIRGFEMDKTPPRTVADNALQAVEKGELDSFPDPMAKQAGEAWLSNPRALETMFASMG